MRAATVAILITAVLIVVTGAGAPWVGAMNPFSAPLSASNTHSATSLSTQTPASPATTTSNQSEEETTLSHQDVEFLNCTAVRVTGNATIQLRTLGYFEAGDYFQDSEHTINGTEIIRGPIREEMLTSTRGYISYLRPVTPGPGVGEAIVNPNREECAQKFRPEKIEIFVVNSTQTGPHTYTVTFGYHNPNNFTMSAAFDYEYNPFQQSFFMSSADNKTRRADLRDGPAAYSETNRSPPTEFHPGRHTFTVEWTPQDEDVALIWILDLRFFRYENPELRAQTLSATEIGSPATATHRSVGNGSGNTTTTRDASV